MFHKYGLVGLIFILVAFILNLFEILPAYSFGLVIPHYFFTIGFWLLLDSLDFAMNKNSILYIIQEKKKIFLYLFLAGITIGIIFEFYGVFIAGVWSSYFNSWPFLKQIVHYPAGIIVGYGIPALIYISLFRISSNLLKKEFGKKLISINFEKIIFRYIGVVGLVLLAAPLILYNFSLSWDPSIRGLLFGFCLFGLWFLLEYIEYKQHKRSFLKDLFEGKWKTPIIIIIVAIVISTIWENLDFIRPSWVYKNLFFMNYEILGLPILLIPGWILLIIVYLSFFRIILKSEDRIW